MDDLKLTVEKDDDNIHPTTTTLPGVGTRKMTSDTVIGSMGGDMGDSSDNNPNSRNQQQPYDGGSLSTHDENDHMNGSSTTNHRGKRRMTAITSLTQRCYGNMSRSLSQRLPCWNHTDTTATNRHPDDLMNEVATGTTHRKSLGKQLVHTFIPSTAFRALMIRNMLYRKRNWISTVR